MSLRCQPLQDSTIKIRALRPSDAARRAILERFVLRATGGDVNTARQIVREALDALALAQVPDDCTLYRLFVRSYVAPRLLRLVRPSIVMEFVARALAETPGAAGANGPR